MKDKFRELEEKQSKNYWRDVTALTFFVVMTLLLTLLIDDDNPGYMEIKLFVNIMILGMQGIFLRIYIITEWAYL